MPYVVSAVVFVGALSCLNLLLVLGVVKRLREHSALLAGGAGAHAGDLDLMPAGERVGAYRATAVDGAPVTRDDTAGEQLVAFVKPGCAPCEEHMPTFIELAGKVTGGREQVLAVVVGTDEEAAPLLDRLSPVARVVIELPDGPLCRAFQVHGYPSYFLLDGSGTVLGAAYRPGQLPVTQPA
ncbi:TlpA disulfide reductase family protein [Actinoplanes sp. NPDC048791]|uniref:TlpA family protein disulfide reductase n=1 Tax=Actinoplanes sp. NPDC048791 TaxID=3154623 RepID=UPI0033D5BA46